MQALYPGLVVTSSHDYWILATNLTITAGYAPPIGSPFGSLPKLVLTTNRSYFPLHKYVTTFANVVTNYYSPNTKAILQTITTGPKAGAPFGSTPATNTSNLTLTYKNVPSGSFYIVPLLGTNRCPADILFTLQKSVVYTTNFLTGASTNVVTTSNTTTTGYSQSLITWYTNFIYVTLPVTCTEAPAPAGNYQGIGKVNFVRVDYDSLVGASAWPPQTNSYNMVIYNHGQYSVQHFDRVVTAPEILLTSSDQAGANTFNGTVFRSINFDQSQVPGGQAGPGVITPGTVFNYNQVGPTFRNGYFANPFLSTIPTVLDETTQIPTAAWASFDDSTNAPVIYPADINLGNLASQTLTQISPLALDNGTNNVPYGPVFFTITTTLFTPPFTWSATDLPPGLTMDPTGILSGTPIQQAPNALVYDIVLTMTDSQNKSMQWTYPIVIQ
jgi:hypothetical protein